MKNSHNNGFYELLALELRFRTFHNYFRIITSIMAENAAPFKKNVSLKMQEGFD